MNRPPAGTRLSGPSIQALKRVILGGAIAEGDEPLAPYRTHSAITDFFDELDAPEWAQANGSREARVNETLKLLNRKPELIERALKTALHPGRFDSLAQCQRAIDQVNGKLRFDGIQASVLGHEVVLSRTDGIEVQVAGELDDPLSDRHLHTLLRRAEHRLQSGEFDTAVTEARTILEDALFELQRRIIGARDDFGGDLVRLYKNVAQAMRLDPARADLNENYRALLRGLTSIVGALAPIANSSSSRHSPTRLPAAHHARLCVNAAKTVVVFLRDSYLAQVQSGLLAAPEVVAPNPR